MKYYLFSFVILVLLFTCISPPPDNNTTTTENFTAVKKAPQKKEKRVVFRKEEKKEKPTSEPDAIEVPEEPLVTELLSGSDKKVPGKKKVRTNNREPVINIEIDSVGNNDTYVSSLTRNSRQIENYKYDDDYDYDDEYSYEDKPISDFIRDPVIDVKTSRPKKTKRPVKGSTKKPTFRPTKKPTPRPTEVPTREPTPKPTAPPIVDSGPAPPVSNTVPGNAWFSPVNSEVRVGSSTSASLMLNTGDKKVAAVGIEVRYNPKILSIDTSQGSKGVESNNPGFNPVVNSNTPGLISIAGFDTQGLAASTSFNLVKIYWIGIGRGRSQISIKIKSLTNETYDQIGSPRGFYGTILVK